MEDEAIVPLRPGFDNEFRGFNRKQVLEHIELLEDQIRILVTDRDEAIRLNEDQRRITDETRRQMEETTNELRRLQNAETGQPYATARMQHMLNMAEEEATAIREHANREAETIRGVAETDAEQIRKEAEERAAELRKECAELVEDLERRRQHMDEEHAARSAELDAKADQLQQVYTSTYEEAMNVARAEADELLRNTRERCADLEERAHRKHSELMADLRGRAERLEEVRNALLQHVEALVNTAGQQRTVLDEQLKPLTIVEPEDQASSTAAPSGEHTQPGNGSSEPTAATGRDTTDTRIPVQSGNGTAESTHRPIPLDPVTEDDPVHEEVPVLNRMGNWGDDGGNQPYSVEYGH
ncbi:hypothetical protein [Actinopolyspora mortivallis]|uniref:Cell division protein DivIVA n=1 Tax=Actinopolyspora mortivallis TaxID=33906 RepID=A0A2T0GZN8_ACTMO|nr:hypothetical protein [Actinopolyspora mortivallis]PRW64569.1 hypothetical protein CEP50_04235 [Actinopolyspora mortivallis]